MAYAARAGSPKSIWKQIASHLRARANGSAPLFGSRSSGKAAALLNSRLSPFLSDLSRKEISLRCFSSPITTHFVELVVGKGNDRAIYAAFDPMHGSIGRDDSAGDTQPQLRPPTDLRGDSCGAREPYKPRRCGNGTALPKAADTGPRGDICLAPGAVTNTAEQNQMTQNTRTAAPVQHHAA